MHSEVCQWMQQVRSFFPEHFTKGRALDVGSLNVNGTNRGLFTGTAVYEGIDLLAGSNVDHVGIMHEWAKTQPPGSYDCIVSTECLEHDRFWINTLMACVSLLKSNGLLVFTCAGRGRAEHGTRNHDAHASEGTLDYYGNLEPADIRLAFTPEYIFRSFCFDQSTNTLGPGYDLRFWGIKGK